MHVSRKLQAHSLLIVGFFLYVAIPGKAAASVLVPVDFSSCMNSVQIADGPVGTRKGNAGTKFSKLTFTLLDGNKGNNAWWGQNANDTLTINLSVPSPEAIYLMLNTTWGVAGYANATVVLSGSPRVAQRTVQLVGNNNIRDWLNGYYTNIINDTTTQEWWTSNLNPSPFDRTERHDVVEIKLGRAYENKYLTQIQIQTPWNGGQNVMAPFVSAIGIEYPDGTPISSTCVY